MSKVLAFVRKYVFRIVFSVAAAEIVVGAININATIFDFDFYFPAVALGIAAAVLTFLTIPVMYGVSIHRKGSYITMVSVEAGWTFILWVLWLAAAIDAILTLPMDCFIDNFDFLSPTIFDPAICDEDTALVGLSFTGSGLLLIYNITLLFLALRQQMRGHTNIWSCYVLETDFSAPSPNASTVVYPTETKVIDGPDGADGATPQPRPQLAVVVPHQYPPATSVQDGGYGGQPMVATPNIA